MGIGIGLGLCFGAALGAATSDVGMWTGLGICFGAACASVFGTSGATPIRKKTIADQPLPNPLGLFTRDDENERMEKGPQS